MYCILIPTVNRADLLAEALYWYGNNLPRIKVFVLDNGHQNIPNSFDNIQIINSETNLGVAKSWNYLIKTAIGENYEHFLVLNDDVVLQRYREEIEALIDRYGDRVFHRPQAAFHWSAFLLSKNVYEIVGEFDERFERCFFEDNDYEYRLKLKNIPIRLEPTLNPQVFRNSKTIEKNPLLGGYIENREFYIKKWGGLPNEEKYTTPFNSL